jgi:formylmethanofuran dehydrogenase subunit E
VHYCDKCGEELGDIYEVDDEELCEECLKDTFIRKV